MSEAPPKESIHVDLEARHLRKIRCRSKIQQVHVVKDFVTVEPAKYENSSIRLQRGVIPPCRWRTSRHYPCLKVERHYPLSSADCAKRTSTDVPKLNSNSSEVYEVPSCPPQTNRYEPTCVAVCDSRR